MKPDTKIEKTRESQARRILILLAAGMCTILSSVFLMNQEKPRYSAVVREAQPISHKESRVASRTIPASHPPDVVTTAAVSPPLGSGTVTPSDIRGLSLRNLSIPVAGVSSGQLHDSFYDSRSEGRTHCAIDIMAPRDTPVLATDDGTVVRLHQSDRGGVMLYQSDSAGAYIYYYGHLTRYADGISEGKAVRRGEVIAYVGDTGNAGAGNYHLHFGISKVTAPGKWSGGEAINPYPLLTGKPASPSIEAGK